MTSKPLVIAHRGASGYRPEHTRAAYALAIELGAEAIEPDVVPTKDGVLVVRHENEISGTTDVASRTEFSSKRCTKTVDGETLTGWFTEDFTWAELRTLRARERLPRLRPGSAAFDGREPILRLSDVRELVDAASIRLVAELKHATYFASLGLPLDQLFADEMAAWATPENLVIESFEESMLVETRDRGVAGSTVFLAEKEGTPADTDRSYTEHLTDDGLARLATRVDGVSPDIALLMRSDAAGNVIGTTDLVDRAHAAGLTVFCWTLRAEDVFLPPNFAGNPEEFFDLVLSTGVDGVFADQPDLALAARRKRHGGQA